MGTTALPPLLCIGGPAELVDWCWEEVVVREVWHTPLTEAN